MTGRLEGFIALVAVLVAIPGPSVLLIVKSTFLRGRRPALLTAVGVACGDLVWAAAAVGGITALVVASRPAFEALRLAGAAYLIYLGLRLLLARAPELATPVENGVPAPRTARRAFTEGLLCELSNPKTLIVFTSVIPQFLGHHAGGGEIALYGLLFTVLGFGSLSIYVLALGRARRAAQRRTRLPALLLRGSGGVLAGFGIGLLADRAA